MYTPEKETLSLEIYEEASRLDPLDLDDVFQVFPEINRSEDVDALSFILNSSVLKFTEKTLTKSESMAALRDIDFLASAYVKTGRNPIEDIAGLEEVMTQLGDVVGTVPRGTVATYALANPAGKRERSFTGDEEESLFIDAVRKTSFALESSLQDLVHEDAGTALTGLSENLDIAIQSVVSVMRTLPPEYFTNEMRPYFDPLTINGKKYLGAGGAQLQFVAFDYVLWGADEIDQTYLGYLHENYSYLTPSQQDAMERIMEKYDQTALLNHISANEDKYAAFSAMEALKKMKKFRYPHRKLAQDNFKVRTPDQVGSGSYTTDILDLLLDKTERAIEFTEEIIRR